MLRPPLPPTHRSRALTIALGALLLTVALVSCGSGSDEVASRTATPVATTDPVPTPTPAATTDPVPTPTPAATTGPSSTATAEPSPDPTTEPSPDPTTPPAATATPDATTTPAATATPTATATPEPTATPAATATPEPTATATPTPQPDRVITAAVGDDFFVSLPLDPTTNFRWELDELPGGSLLTLIDEITIAPGGGTTQDAGWQHFVFRGKNDGQATLSFWFVRPNGMPIEAVHYSVIIGSGSPVCSEVFEVAIGETFEVVLQSNSSTGFRWELSEQPSSEIVSLVKEEYIAPSATAVGASGWQRFTFEGTGDGETDLDFWYVRPFDDPPAPANLANYKAVVGTGIPGCSAVFTIAIGEDLDIALGADPSTGYRWELSEAPTEGVLTLIKDEFVPGTSTGVGTPGIQTLTFRGTTAGETPLTLWSVRPFDDPAVPADTIAFMVIVS